MTNQDPWFLEERAFAFASLVLTKRKGVVVRAHAGTDMAVDLLVEVLKHGKSRLRFFGVQLVAYLDLPNIEKANDHLLSNFSGEHLEGQLPICVFVIGVRKPEGIYSWGMEPAVDHGRALLNRDAEANWQTLDEAGAARLTGQVDAWYDALNRDSIANGTSRHSKTFQ